MITSEKLYEIDLLYPTEVDSDPGSINIKIFNPGDDGTLPIVVENISKHSVKTYLKTILKSMQKEIFDRVSIDIVNNSKIYIKKINDDTSNIVVIAKNGKFEYKNLEVKI